MKTILVVEDEKNLRLLYQQDLSDAGYRVLLAENGEKAIQTVSQEAIDLAILDIKMAGIDGIDTLRKIMEIDKNIKVILNSAYSTFKSDFSTWSADAYLVKSSNLDELKSKIKELLETV
ncbi:response regulator [candidate division KSB1 bacterium]|nr:response regulator [candidate division KSB1 bacterium]